MVRRGGVARRREASSGDVEVGGAVVEEGGGEGGLLWAVKARGEEGEAASSVLGAWEVGDADIFALLLPGNTRPLVLMIIR